MLQETKELIDRINDELPQPLKGWANLEDEPDEVTKMICAFISVAPQDVIVEKLTEWGIIDKLTETTGTFRKISFEEYYNQGAANNH